MTDVDQDAGAVFLDEGQCAIFDADYLDPECEAQGVLGMWYPVGGPMFYLFGSGEGAGYAQEWRPIAPDKKRKPVLKSV
ncbi:MAG: hypothetical protein JSR70_07620 [Proteobacteria bacterium]|nr:hypothetical protein [Pseudomonadota bacterium]